MRIIIFDKVAANDVDGISKYSERLRKYFTDRRHEIFFLRFSNTPSADPHIIHLPYHIAEPRLYIFAPSFHALTLIQHHLDAIKPDLLYMYLGLSPIDFFIPYLSHKRGVPIAGIWHEDFNTSFNAMQVFMKILFFIHLPITHSLDLLQVFSDKMKNFHVRFGIKPKKITVLTNGVNESFYTPGQSTFGRKHAIKKGVLFLGRLTFQKNPKALLDAFLKTDPPPSTKLVLVGGGDMEQKLRSQYKDARIIFTGIILNDKDKRDIIRSCQIIVQPSLMEGVSLALLEAMSCGLAAITSDAGNYATLLKNAGKIIPMSSLSTDLPRTLRYFFNHPSVVASMGRNARNTVVKHHSETTIYGKLFEVFTQIVPVRATATSSRTI